MAAKRAPRRKPCPHCGSRDTARILYGLYVPDPEHPLPEHTVLGGCTISPHQPLRHCHSCGRGYDFRDDQWVGDQ